MEDEAATIIQLLPTWQRLSLPEYNCSRVMPTGTNWTVSRGVPQPLFGYWSIFWGALCEILYIPCTIALYRERRHPCYRIMLWLAIVDMIALATSCISFGFLIIEGVVFCSRPALILFIGCTAMGMWCGACVGCLLLVTYRLFELMQLGRRFEAQTNVLIATATCYILFFAILTPPPLTNSGTMAMFFDPFIGDGNVLFLNWAHTANNLLIVLTSAVLYILFCIMFLTKQAETMSEDGRAKIAANAPIFIQASLICIFNVTASLEYIYMNFFPTPTILIEIGHVSWQLTHGVPPFIYLLLNNTVKKHIRIMFKGKPIISPTTVIQSTFVESLADV